MLLFSVVNGAMNAARYWQWRSELLCDIGNAAMNYLLQDIGNGAMN
jgi:hypothetical protein